MATLELDGVGAGALGLLPPEAISIPQEKTTKKQINIVVHSVQRRSRKFDALKGLTVVRPRATYAFAYAYGLRTTCLLNRKPIHGLVTIQKIERLGCSDRGLPIAKLHKNS